MITENHIKKTVQEFIQLENDPHIGIMLTDGCNLNCEGCISGVDNRRKLKGNQISFISKELIFVILEQLKDPSLSFSGRVAITGGEPGLHPDFIELTELIAKLNCYVYITTNAMWINPNQPLEKQKKFLGLIDLLKNYSNLSVKFPISSVYPNNIVTVIVKKVIEYLENHPDMHYGIQYGFSRIADNLKSLVEESIRFGFKISKNNVYHVIKEWRKKLKTEDLQGYKTFVQISPKGEVFDSFYELANGLPPYSGLEGLTSLIQKRREELADITIKRGKHPALDENIDSLAEQILKTYTQLTFQ